MRIAFVAVALVALTTPVAAQDKYVGLAVGAVDSHFHSSTDADFKTQSRGSVGLVLARDLNRILRFQGEVAYIGKGSRGPGVTSVRSRFLEVPLTLRAQTKLWRVSPFVNAGVSYAKELSCSNLTFDPLVDPVPGTSTLRRDIGCSWFRDRKWDITRVLGVGVAHRAGRMETFAEARISTSIVDMNPGANGDRLRNEAYQLRLGVLRAW